MAFAAYGRRQATEKFLCSYGLNESYRGDIFRHGLCAAGEDGGGNVRIIELRPHPFFMATLFVPQLSSEYGSPHPLIAAFLEAAAAVRGLHHNPGELRQTTRGTPHVRAFRADEWRVYRDLRLRALADSPDSFGSTLAEAAGRLDAEWSSRLESWTGSRWDLPLVAAVGGEPIGLAWGHIDPADTQTAVLYQMWVSPSHRRLGAGEMLLEGVIAWAKACGAAHLNLDVTCGDRPARRLYERAGFRQVGEPQPLRPGSELLEQPMRLALRKVPKPSATMRKDTPGEE